MRIGLFSVVDHYPDELERSLAQFYEELLAQGVLADSLGFDSFWLAEHHFHEYGVIPRPAIFLAALAAKSKQIRLGSAVAILPFDNPLRVAEDFAMLDILSAGRLEFGAGSGYLAHEFAGFAVDAESRRERFDEALAIIMQAWSGKRFSFAGKHFNVDNLQLNVLPLQKPHPEVSIAVLRNEVAKFVGMQRRAMITIPYASTENVSAELTATCAEYREAFLHAADLVSNENHTADAFAQKHQYAPRVRFALHCYCAENTREARDFARPYMDRYVRTRLYARQRDFDDLISKDLIAMGDPEEIVRVARVYENAGMDDFLMIMNFGGLPAAKVEESMKLVAAEVLPQINKAPSLA